ncbi:MAG: AAA family ATPase [Planctomycetota bacterium]
MDLNIVLMEYVRAAFSGLYIRTLEPDEALREIAQQAQQQQWHVATWDIDRGLQVGDTTVAASDPLAAIRALSSLATAERTTSLLVLRNFHRFLGSAEVIQALEHQLALGKTNRTFVVILAPVVQLPLELERLFVVIDHPLPGRAQLAEIARGIATEPGELPEGDHLELVLDTASGLTRSEAEGAFSLSLARHGRLEPTALWELKTQTLLKSGLLSLHRGGESFSQLGGLDSLKAFCLRALRAATQRAVQAQARGVLLLGVSGSGKSAFAKALGHETGRPTLLLDVGALMGSLVGQSEERTRQALQIVDAMAPAVLMIDEVEKALAGVATSGQTDSGVTSRMFGALLSWLNDHTSDVFVVCTANDVRRLPPEFSRAERFDGVFFLDLPGASQKQAIWQMGMGHFELDAKQRLPTDDQWTGAEIRACCRLAALLDVPLIQAADQIVPVAVTASESVESLRTWASGRCLSADHRGLFTRTVTSPSAPRRRVTRDPSNN